MKPSNAEKWLMNAQPLMRVLHRLEFQQRLQWLSEGMMHRHLEPALDHHPDIVTRELEDYQMFCILRAYEKGKK